MKRDEWTEEMVLALPAGEHDFFERKSGMMLTDASFRDDFAKALSALANSGGGHLVLGVMNDGVIDGVPPAYRGRQPTREWLEQVIPNLLSYPLQDFRVHEVTPSATSTIPAGTVVIVIDVGDSVLAPHQTSDSKNYYYRSGGRSEKAPHVYLEALRARRRFPSRRVVRAWLDTVINPLVSALERAQEVLNEKKFSWGLRGRRIDGLPFINHYPGIHMRFNSQIDINNMGQFFDSHPEAALAVDEFDSSLLTLGERYTSLHQAVVTSEAFIETYRMAASPESLLRNRSTFFGSEETQKTEPEEILEWVFGRGDEASRLALIAEHVVNGEGELDHSRRVSNRFWNLFKDEFLKVLDDPSVRPLYEAVLEGQSALLERLNKLIDLLRRTRTHLATEHGEPFTDPSRRGDTSWW